jgi:hypothetical protein
VATAGEAFQKDGGDSDSDYSDDPEDCYYYTDDGDVHDPDCEEDEHDASCGASASLAAGTADATAAGTDRALDRQLLRELLGTVQEQRAVIAALKKQLRARK